MTSVPRDKWHRIIQQGVDAARYIDAGVISTDCQSRNVVLRQDTLHPFHIDFAQCLFAKFLGWRRFGETKFRLGNQEAIEAVMVGKLKRAGVRLPEIRYIDRDWDRLESILSRFSCSMFLLGAPWLGIWGVVVVGLLGWAVARAAGV